MNRKHEMKTYADAAIALDHIYSARDKIRDLVDLHGLEYSYNVNRELARISNGLLVFMSDYEDLSENAKNIAIEGLSIDGGHHKQWFLEEIIKALGYDIGDIGMEIEWEEGVAP